MNHPPTHYNSFLSVAMHPFPDTFFLLMEHRTTVHFIRIIEHVDAHPTTCNVISPNKIVIGRAKE